VIESAICNKISQRAAETSLRISSAKD